jgi:hypothetical protein
MQFITVEGVKFIVYIEGKRIIADAIDIQATFQADAPDGTEYTLPNASKLPPDFKIMFISDYTKITVGSGNATIVLKHPAVIGMEPNINKLRELYYNNTIEFMIAEWAMYNTIITKEQEHISNSLNKQTETIKNYIAKLKDTLQ